MTKKSFLLILLLFSVIFPESDCLGQVEKSSAKGRLVFVSWNACNFGCSKSYDEIGFMADILKNADIIALQEVSTSNCGAQATAKLADELNRKGAKWDYIVTESTHDSPSKERYSFLWKTKRISLSHRNGLLLSGLSSKMEREPALVELQIEGKSFFIASFHLAPTKKNPRSEVEFLGANSKYFDKQNIILCGDFNLAHGEMSDVFENAMGFKANISGKTSLKSKPTKKGEYLNKEYDNVFTKGIVAHKASIINFVSRMIAAGDIDLSREDGLSKAKTISDHLPVSIEFSF